MAKEPSSKTCSTCAEQIPVAALRCKNCDSFQDWRRHLSFSSTVLALLVALLSVLTVLIPVAKDRLFEKGADIRVSAVTISWREMSFNEFFALVGEQASPSPWPGFNQRFQFHKLSFVASNSGDAPEVITHLTINGLNVQPLTGHRIKTSSFRLCDSKGACGPIVVGPKETLSFVGYGDAWKSYAPADRLQLNIRYVDINGSSKTRVFYQEGVADQRMAETPGAAADK